MSVSVLEADMSSREGELTDAARATLWSMWGRRASRARHLQRMRDYAEGKGGVPDLDEGASQELRDLALLSPLNLCGVVVDAFDRGASVVGFRSPTESDDEPAWALWQANRMDARQSEVHRAALVYGESYVSVLPNDEREYPEFVTWSPLDAVVEYDDPRRDLFPREAMLLRRATVDGEEVWSVLLVDSTTVRVGKLLDGPKNAKGSKDGVRQQDVILTGESWEHGATYNGRPVCPVVRFVNERSAEDRVPRGEVEPIIGLNRAANAVNLDRLITARFGAFQQKVVIGWAGSKTEALKLASSTVLAFEDDPEAVKVQSLPASPLEPYNGLLREIKEQVALQASIPIYAATGTIANVSTDTAAMVESAHQRKLKRKRTNWGESWEQMLRLGVAMSGLPQPDEAAEVIWDETEARSFAAVVDGMVKIASVPPEGQAVLAHLLDLIPGMTQQRTDALRDEMRRGRAVSTIAGLIANGQEGPAPDGVPR